MALDGTIILPSGLTAAGDKYRHCHAAMEAVRLKHNTRAGDLSPSARAFRLECRRIQAAIADEILKLRPQIIGSDGPPDPKEPEAPDPAHARLKQEGRADYSAVDLKAVTGVDLDAFQGAAAAPPDPTENFTTYTEVDSAGDITVAASSLTMDTMRQDADSYVYKDFTADHFQVGLEHYVTVVASSMAMSCWGGVWAVTNVFGSYADMDGNEALVAHVYQYGGLATSRHLRLINAEDSDADSYMIAVGTTYYCTADWTGATTVTFKIYSDSDRTNLLSTLTIAVTSGRKYRYVQGMLSKDEVGTVTISYVVSNLDLNELKVLSVSDINLATSLDTVHPDVPLIMSDVDIATSLDTVGLNVHLAVSDLALATSLDTFALTQAHTLAIPSGLDLATSIDLVQPVGVMLVMSDIDLATSLDTVALNVHLVMSDVNLATSLDTFALTQAHVLAMPSGIDLATALDSFPLTQAHILAMQDCDIAIWTHHPLVMSGVDIGVGIDTVAVGVRLAVSGLALATSLDGLAPSIRLNVSDLAAATSLDTITLVPDTVLDVDDLDLAASIDAILATAPVGAVVATFTGSRPSGAPAAV